MISRQFQKFILTGGAAALVNLGSRHLLSNRFPFEISVAVAYLFGMATAYALARLFVFEASGRSIASELWRFGLVNLASLAIVWSVSVSLLRVVFPAIGFIWRTEDVAHFSGVIAPVVFSYFAHRFYTFAGRGR